VDAGCGHDQGDADPRPGVAGPYKKQAARRAAMAATTAAGHDENAIGAPGRSHEGSSGPASWSNSAVTPMPVNGS